MIRQPSSEDQLLAWHRAFIAGENPPRHDSDPQCGWYRIQLVKNGPWTPVTIWCDREIDPETGELACDEALIADVFGENKPAESVWTFVEVISHHEFERLQAWRLRNQHKFSDRKRVDLAAQPTLPGV